MSKALYAVGIIVFVIKFWMGLKAGTVSPDFTDILSQWWQAFFYGALIVGLGRLISLLEQIYQKLSCRSS